MEIVKSTFSLKGVVDSRIGGRTENQDYYGYYDTPVGTAVIVCDGMGGMQGGQVASQLAVNTILQYLVNCEPGADTVESLTNAIRVANSEILKVGSENKGLRGMGTTVTALILTEECATIAYMGDSRVYQIRGGRKVFRTFDHSMVFEMVKGGLLTEEQARLSDQSNVILQALGIYPEIEPTVYKRPYCKGDIFMLCTDGFWGAMPERDLLSLISEKAELAYVLEHTGNRVNGIGREKGGHFDNLTAALIQVECDYKMKEKMNKKAKIIISVLAALLALSLVGNVCLLVKKGDKPVKETIENVQTDKTPDAAEMTETPAETDSTVVKA